MEAYITTDDSNRPQASPTSSCSSHLPRNGSTDVFPRKALETSLPLCEKLRL